jgi:O-antigen/teichoic acid export membrane protein
MSKVRRSLIYCLIERNGNTVLGLAGTLILARLLTPADFGVYAVSLSIVTIIDVVRDFGVGTYLVQERQLTDAIVQSVFTFSLAMSLICAGVLLAVTLPIAAYYAEPKLAGIVPLLACTFLLGPFSTPGLSLLRRDMEFGKLAVIGLVSATASLALTVLFAASGFGYLSLPWAKVASSLVGLAALLLYRPALQAFRLNFVEWRKIAGFGGYASATAIVNVIHDALPQMIVGGLLGFNAVGLLGRAVSICQIPDRLFTSALAPVLLPSLSKQARSSGDLKRAYLQSITYISALQWPTFVCLAILADPAVRLLLGSQWEASIPLVRIMALGSLFLFPAFLTYPTLVAAGAIRDALISSLISIPPSLLLICLASRHGLQAVAATQFITGPLQVYVAVRFTRRHVPFTWGEFFAPVLRSAVIAVCAAAPAGLVIALSEFRLDLGFAAMAASCIGAGVGWLFGVWITRHPFLAELQRFAVLGRWQGLRLSWRRFAGPALDRADP